MGVGIFWCAPVEFCWFGWVKQIVTFTLDPIHLRPISNPTPRQTHPNWLGQLMHPYSRGSWTHPNNQGSWPRPGWGRRCARALPSRLTANLINPNFGGENSKKPFYVWRNPYAPANCFAGAPEFGAFLKKQRHKIICYFDINSCLFNPKFNHILCFLNITRQICTNSPLRCKNCLRTYLRHIFLSPPLNVPLLVTSREKSRTPPPPHAAACRPTRHCCMPPLHTAPHRCCCRRTLPHPATAVHCRPTLHPAAAATNATDDGNRRRQLLRRQRQQWQWWQWWQWQWWLWRQQWWQEQWQGQ